MRLGAFKVRSGLVLIAFLALGGVVMAVRGRTPAPLPLEGLPEPRRPIHVRMYADGANLRYGFYAYSSRPENERDLCRLRAQALLGLTPLATTGVVHPSLSAFYPIGTDTVHVVEGARHLRHEAVHALHDQYADLRARYTRATTTDARIAFTVVAEGVARALSGEGAGSLAASENFGETVQSLATTVGPRFVSLASGGDALQAFQIEAGSVHEIMFGPVADTIVPPPTLSPGERVLCEDRLGVAAVIAALEAHSARGADAAVLDAWRGDRLTLVHSPGGERVIWAVRFADSESARAWRQGPAMLLPLTRAATSMPVYTASQ